MGEHERHNQHGRPKDEDVPVLAQFETPDPAHKEIAGGKVEKAPKDVDRRRGQRPDPRVLFVFYWPVYVRLPSH